MTLRNIFLLDMWGQTAICGKPGVISISYSSRTFRRSLGKWKSVEPSERINSDNANYSVLIWVLFCDIEVKSRTSTVITKLQHRGLKYQLIIHWQGPNRSTHKIRYNKVLVRNKVRGVHTAQHWREFGSLYGMLSDGLTIKFSRVMVLVIVHNLDTLWNV
jgi:hypothetical protein